MTTIKRHSTTKFGLTVTHGEKSVTFTRGEQTVKVVDKALADYLLAIGGFSEVKPAPTKSTKTETETL